MPDLNKALMTACQAIADFTGSCPYDTYDCNLDCEEGCNSADAKLCWYRYFTEKAGGYMPEKGIVNREQLIKNRQSEKELLDRLYPDRISDEEREKLFAEYRERRRQDGRQAVDN